MIKSLHISNYALISQIDIDFDAGFNIITGETGAGKSIILGALSLLLGGRSDSRSIGDSTRKSVIEAEFILEDPSRFEEFFKQNDLDTDGNRCILRREISPGGRSRAFINDSPVNLSVLREIAIQLVDIHSQHQNLLLADADYQLSVIDALAGNAPLLDEYRQAYAEYQRVLKRYSSTRDMIRRNSDDADFLSYQLEQIDQLSLSEGEQEELEAERDAIADQADIKTNLVSAIDSLADGENNVIDSLNTAAEAIRELPDSFDEAESLAARIDTVAIEIQDIADTLRRHDEACTADPARLEAIQERLAEIYSLESKHHVETSDGLLALRADLAKRLDAVANGDVILADLEAKGRAAKKKAMILARRISDARHNQAEIFAARLRDTAEPLGMKNLRCDIALTTGKLNPSGIDSVEFLFAFNKNQELMPVGATASGGEISRLMLSVKSIIGDSMNLPSIIFDEVDTGVSGEIAARMGRMMQLLSHKIQIITITHLPQVAARGESHFKVYKADSETSTNTYIRRLDDEDRVTELSAMLGGSDAGETAAANARSLLEAAKSDKTNK